MAQKTRTVLKSFFQTGQIPSENNYKDLIDSFSHLEEANTGNLLLTGSVSITGSTANIDIGGSQGDLKIKGNISGSTFVNVSGSSNHYTASTTPVGGYHIDYYGNFKNSLTRGRLSLQASGTATPTILEQIQTIPGTSATALESINSTLLKVPGIFSIQLTGSNASHKSNNKFIVTTQNNGIVNNGFDDGGNYNSTSSPFTLNPLLRISSSGHHLINHSLTITGSNPYGILGNVGPRLSIFGPGQLSKTEILPASMSMEVSGVQKISINGNKGDITASGDISSSGNITCAQLNTDGQINVGSNLTMTGDVDFTFLSGITGSSAVLDGGNNSLRADKGLSLLLGRGLGNHHVNSNIHGFKIYRNTVVGGGVYGTNNSFPDGTDPDYHHTFPDNQCEKIFDISLSGSIHKVNHITSSGNIWVSSSLNGTNPYSVFLSTTGHVTASGNISASGTILASNFSGTTSGTNTGDQDLSNLVTNSQTGSFAVTSSNVQFGNVTASNIMVGNNGNIYHDQGTKNTYIGFEDDEINFVLGGQQFLTLDEQGTTDTIKFGTSGHDVDFQISNAASNPSITVKGDTGFVGISKAAPTAQLHVNGTIVLDTLPTSDPTTAGQLFTQTAVQLGGTGTTKVLCISAG
tara:strand:+ start:636 stop:2534 length:1899 start_codon:yes stop_codon:yes gene_type:complete